MTKAVLARRDVRTGLSGAVALATLAIALEGRAFKAAKDGERDEDWQNAAAAAALLAMVTALATAAWSVPFAFDAKYGDGPLKGALQAGQVSFAVGAGTCTTLCLGGVSCCLRLRRKGACEPSRDGDSGAPL